MKNLLTAIMFGVLFAPAVIGQTHLDPEWVYRWEFAPDVSDQGDAMACDQFGNIFVTGHTDTDTSSTHDDWVTLGLNSSGDSLWLNFYDSPLDGIDRPEFIAVDDSGYIYVSGDCGASSLDWEMNAVTIKYDQLGNMQWIHDYNGPSSMDDRIENFALDNNGYPIIVGYSEISGGKDYLVIKLQPNGDTAWVRTMPTGNSTFDRLYAVAFDANNNIYVAGGKSTGGIYDIATIKYTPDGDTLWTRIYDGASSGNDLPYGIGVDDSGYVYVGGYTNNSNNTNKDFLAIKYDSNGTFIWDAVYNGAGNGSDNTKDAIVDSDGNTYVLGETTDGGQRDILVTKFANDGTLDWFFQYDSGGNMNELVFNSKNLLNIDQDGNIYFGGATYYVPAGATLTNTLTFKLDPDGNIVWYGRYGGPGLDFDQIRAVTLDNNSNCYVTGYSDGIYDNWDLFVLKYPSGSSGGCDYVVGDVNNSVSFNGLDITYGVAYFKGGAEPLCTDCPDCAGWWHCGDVNASCSYNGLDITFGVAYFKGGAAPSPCADCPPLIN